MSDGTTHVGWGYRHQQCFILFLAYTIGYSMKSCVGVALVAMTKYNESNMTEFQGENASLEFKPEGIMNTLILVPPYPTFKWDKKVQDTIIASFYWGHMILQLPAGQIAYKFGVRYLLAGTLMVNSIVFTMLPIAAYYGTWYCFVVCRILQGLSQACLLPALHTSLGKWTPLKERGRLSGLVYGGLAVGTVLGLPITGFISASPMGWPGVFRFYGMISGIMASVVWFLLSNTPAEHPKISFLEQKYIEDDTGKSENQKNLSVPWMKIIRHKGTSAIIFAHIAHTWGHLTLYSEIPAFMDKIMGVNIKMNGLLTALPFLVMWFSNFFFSWLTDWLIIKNILSVTNTRKFANSLGYISAGIGLIVLAYAPSNIYIVETLLVMICAFKISASSGFLVNHMDISPHFAGILMSISNSMANAGASVSPMVIGFILTDVNDKYLWRQVFFLTAGVYLSMNLLYVTLGTSERAEWNDPPEEDKEVEEIQTMMNKTE